MVIIILKDELKGYRICVCGWKVYGTRKETALQGRSHCAGKSRWEHIVQHFTVWEAGPQ